MLMYCRLEAIRGRKNLVGGAAMAVIVDSPSRTRLGVAYAAFP
jgi:hypothetical protein